MADYGTLWPLAMAIGFMLFVLSFVITEYAPSMALRVISIVAFAVAAIFAIPGIG